MSAKPIKFSEQFKVDPTKLSELGVFDPFLNHDTRLFVDLYRYIDKKTKEIESAEALFSSTAKLKGKLNYRQLAVIKHAMKHPGFVYTIVEHQNSHGIAYDTARIDLSQLADKLNFLIKEKSGKGFVFRSPKDLTKRIQNEVK